MKEWKCIQLTTHNEILVSGTVGYNCDREKEMPMVAKTIEKYEQQGWTLFTYHNQDNSDDHRLLFYREK